MIQVMYFSKDRACQLDLTLTSMKKHFKEWKDQEHVILYTYSNDEYRKGYERVMQLHPEFKWVKETNFRSDTIRLFNESQRPYVAFLVDDDVFLDDLTLESQEFKTFTQNTAIACLSPRMAPYVTFCYTANIPAPPPAFGPGLKIWNWQDPKLCGDWNYPMSIASFHVFRREDLARPINIGNFRAPNSFEGTCLAPNPPNHRPLMICYENAKCFCVTNNRVQTENGNRHENSAPLDQLNAAFVAGKRLSPHANYLHKANTAHGPAKYIWE